MKLLFAHISYKRFCVLILDGIPQDEEHVYISLPLLIVYTIIAIIGIIFTVICLGLDLWFREQKYVNLLSQVYSNLVKCFHTTD